MKALQHNKAKSVNNKIINTNQMVMMISIR